MEQEGRMKNRSSSDLYQRSCNLDGKDDGNNRIPLDPILQDLFLHISDNGSKDPPPPKLDGPIAIALPTSPTIPILPQGSGQQHISTIAPELLPINWPCQVKYLIDYEYHPSISSSLLDLVQGRRRRKLTSQQGIVEPELVSGARTCAGLDAVKIPLQEEMSKEEQEEVEEVKDDSRNELEKEYDEIPIGHAISGVLRTPSSSTAEDTAEHTASTISKFQDPLSPPFEIRLITSPLTHPVLGSYGLFATRLLRPGTHLLDYISLVVPDSHADPDSDHTLYLSNDLNLDASVHGNHGRFVNDFRGIRTQEQGPNVGWDLYRDADSGQIRMGCKVLKRIRPGEEILCTYGKSYWKSRGVPVTGNEWEDGWDTDLEDRSDDEENDGDGQERKEEQQRQEESV